MSNKMWDALLEHAKTCGLSGKFFVYYHDDTRNTGVVFNNICELSGLINGEQYFSADSLSDSQKVGMICVICFISVINPAIGCIYTSGAIIALAASLSVSLSHTHTHTHIPFPPFYWLIKQALNPLPHPQPHS